MNLKFKLISIGILFLFAFPVKAKAHYVQRLSLGAGIGIMGQPSQTFLVVGTEYEYRFNPMLGLGTFGNYYFSNPGLAIIGIPEIFVHPLATDWLVNTAPIVMFGSGTNTALGVRIGTRVPLPLGDVTLIPMLAIDFIQEIQIYTYGLGLQF